jgi:hypothetical protein
LENTANLDIVSAIQLQVYTECRWLAGKLFRKEDPKYWFKYMELFEDGFRADGAGVWDAIENQVEILKWDNPDIYRGGDENED